MTDLEHRAIPPEFVSKHTSSGANPMDFRCCGPDKTHLRRFLTSLFFFLLDIYFVTCPLPYCIETLVLCIGSMHRQILLRRPLSSFNPCLSETLIAMSTYRCLLMELVGIYLMLLMARMFGVFCILRFKTLHLLHIINHQGGSSRLAGAVG